MLAAQGILDHRRVRGKTNKSLLLCLTTSRKSSKFIESLCELGPENISLLMYLWIRSWILSLEARVRLALLAVVGPSGRRFPLLFYLVTLLPLPKLGPDLSFAYKVSATRSLFCEEPSLILQVDFPLAFSVAGINGM